jgi:phosphoglycerate dehydrogenase-like enzyme
MLVREVVVNVVALVAAPSSPELAQAAYTGMLGAGWTVNAYSTAEDVPDDVAAATDIVIPAAGVTVDDRFIKRCPELKLIQVPGHGFDHIDMAAAHGAGIPVATVASSGAEAHTVAEMAILLAGVAGRRILEGDRFIREGQWGNLVMLQRGIFELAGKTIGVVGMGRIGREVTTRAKAFDMRVVYYDAFRLDGGMEADLGVEFMELDVLLAEADIVSLHAPLTPETTGMINDRTLGLMKPMAVLVNTARGPLVDAAALAKALTEGRIRAAAIDVFDPEPPHDDNPLRTAPNCILSPHMAGVTAESILRILAAAIQNVQRLAAGEPVRDVVAEGATH